MNDINSGKKKTCISTKKSTLLISVIVLALIMCFLPSAPVYADDTDTDINVSFYSPLSGKTLSWDFLYSDALFRTNPEDFSEDFVKASLGLMVSAFGGNTEEKKAEEDYKVYLKGAGFEDIYTFGYDQETSKDSLAGVIGWKKVDDFLVIAAVPRGQGYGKEWGGNLEVGDEERHVGFNNAARLFEKEIWDYIERYSLTGTKKLWLAGFSRASAVSNLTAADMIDSGEFADVYAYLFGVPRTTRDPDRYEYTGIYNICGKYDPVTQIPFESWGYGRYGSDLFTPAQEMDSKYYEFVEMANNVSIELTGDLFYNNPEMNYQIHMILEFLGELFPTSADYADKFQDILMKVWTEAEPDRIINILLEAISQLEDLDKRQEKSTEVLQDYLSMIASQHLKEEQGQVKVGYWNSNVGIAENAIREHMPYTYIDWAFSGCNTDDLYYGQEFSRRLSFFGNINIEIWSGDSYIIGIDSDGEFIFRETDDYVTNNVFIMRNGDETFVNFPVFDTYSIVISADKVTNLIYYDVIYSPHLTYGVADTMFVQTLTDGEYRLEVEALEDLKALNAVDGSIYNFAKTEFTYSPTMVMANESSSRNYVTMTDILEILFFALLFIIILLFVCLVISIVHMIIKRVKGKTYSPWFVIVPHLLLIIFFILLTQFFTVNMFSIGHTRMACAGLSMLVMFLLALRGLIRNRNIVNLVITLGLLVIGVANLLIYQNGKLVSSSWLHFAIYCVCMAGLTVLAVSTFFRKKAKKVPEAKEA